MKNPKELNAVEFLELEDFVCNRRDSCENCIAMQYGMHNGYDSCGEIRIKEPEKVIMLMMQQADKIKQKEAAKPKVKTLKDQLLELYPNTRLNKNGVPKPCAESLGLCDKCTVGLTCEQCWNRPVEILVEKEKPCKDAECNCHAEPKPAGKDRKVVGDLINLLTEICGCQCEEDEADDGEDLFDRIEDGLDVFDGKLESLADKWISCKDRMPSRAEGEVEILLEDKTIVHGIWLPMMGWASPDLFGNKANIIAWRPYDGWKPNPDLLKKIGA